MLAFVLILSSYESAFSQPSRSDQFPAISRQFSQLYSEGKFRDALPVAKEMLRILEKRFGSNDARVATALSNISMLHRILGNLDEAEPPLGRAVQIRETVLGKNHPDVAVLLISLGELAEQRGDYVMAEQHYLRGQSLLQKAYGASDFQAAKIDLWLAGVYGRTGRLEEASRLLKSGIAASERSLGAEHVDMATSLARLAATIDMLGRQDETEQIYLRAIRLIRRSRGNSHPDLGAPLHNLAELYADQGRLAEAEPLMMEALRIRQAAFGEFHPDVAATVNNLGGLYQRMGRSSDATKMFEQASAINERVLGPDHPEFALALGNIATARAVSGDLGTEVEQTLQRAARILADKLGPNHPQLAIALGNLSGFYHAKRNWKEAVAYGRQAAAITRRKLERGVVDQTAASWEPEALRNAHDFSTLVKSLYRLSLEDASNSATYADEAFEVAQWAANSAAAISVAEMAARSAAKNSALEQLTRERKKLVETWAVSDRSLIQVFAKPQKERNGDEVSRMRDRLAETTARIAEIDARLAREFPAHASLASSSPISVAEAQSNLRDDEALILTLVTGPLPPTVEETFVWVVTRKAMRWSQSLGGKTLVKQHVAALRCSLDPAALQKEQAKRCLEAMRLAPESGPKAGELMPFDAARAAELYNMLLGRAGDLIEGKHLLFVPFGALTSLPMHVLVKSLPKGVEAGRREKTVARIGIEFRPPTTEQARAAGLPDTTGAFVGRTVAEGPADRAGIKPGDLIVAIDGTPLEAQFNLAAAVSQRVPGSIARVDLVRSGERRSLDVELGSAIVETWTPYEVDTANARAIRWVARDHAITVLPAASSLTALRRVARPSKADRTLIGFGNPLLEGPDERYRTLAAQARTIDRCPKTALERLAALLGLRRGGVKPLGFVRGVADQNHLKAQVPLPETAEELCAVARDLKSDLGDVHLGSDATEMAIKQLSESGELARYKVLHFATHGTLAGALSGTTEPGLILSPPATASTVDDGYLAGSEIASLKLDADWVILSACNTAGSANDVSAEALSGLARVFFYAGARALLVSHWEVYSEATVKLITKAVRGISDGTAGRAEALRQAMLDMIDNGSRHEAHPSYWAPFVVVGEGATPNYN